MPKPDYAPFIKKATTVIRQTGNPFNIHTSRMAERVSSLVQRLKGVAEDAVLSPEDFERVGSQAGEFRASEQAMKRFATGPAGKQGASMVAKYTRKGILESGSKAGTIAPRVLKDIGAAPGSSFSELAQKATEAFKKIQPELKGLLQRSAESIKAAAKAGDKGAVAAMKSRVFKFVQKGDLPIILMDIVPEIEETEREGELRKQGA